MSNFRHVDAMRHLLEELFEVNERIMCGDICSAKTAIASANLKKILTHYHEALSEEGATMISLQAYAAAGGWIGITYSFEIDGCHFEGSQVPRRV
jgi:hypothetical protein